MFDQTVLVCIQPSESFDKLMAVLKLGIKNDDDNGALCINSTNRIIIWVDANLNLKTKKRLIIHEIVHAVNYIKENTAIEANDEFDACMISYIVSECESIFK